MKRFGFYIMLCALSVFASCEQDEMKVGNVGGDGFTLVGKSTVGTKTSFGTPESGTIPFLWQAGDCIYVNGIWSEGLQEGGATAEFVFNEGSVKAGDAVYYGAVDFEMVPGTCQVLTCPWQSGDSKDLSYNCEFGYAVVGSDNSFALEHYSSYLWLNTYSQDVTKRVAAVTITAENDIVGFCEFDESARKFVGRVSPMIPEEDVTMPEEKILAQTRSVVLNFQDSNYDPAPKQLLAESSADEIWAVAVILPVTTGSLRIDYEFEDGSRASYNYPTKDLAAGTTYRITQEIKAADLYELRTLTFEDEQGSTYWADLMTGEDMQSYGSASPLIYNLTEPYTWQDEYTRLKHEFPFNWGGYGFSGGGYVVSQYTGSLEDLSNASDMYYYQLSIPLAGGHNSSSNFVVGYHDSNIDAEDEIKPALVFYDDVARVIDHMYITNASVTMYCMTYGNQFSDAYDDDDYLDVVATGYNGDVKGSTIKFRLAEGADMKVKEWVKWDLSQLGAVTKVVFHMEEAQVDDYGYAKYTRTPMFFAYDDVTVRFGVE